jgi:hypothetical protein
VSAGPIFIVNTTMFTSRSLAASSGPPHRHSLDTTILGSYGLYLRIQQPSEAFEVEDPPDQVGLLADSVEASTAEAAEAMPVFALAKQRLDLLPASLRQLVAESAYAHPHAAMGQAVGAGVDRDVGLNNPVEIRSTGDRQWPAGPTERIHTTELIHSATADADGLAKAAISLGP